MCVALLAGVWWIVPLIGLVMCLGFMVMAFRFARRGNGGICCGVHRNVPDDQVARSGREVNPEASR